MSVFKHYVLPSLAALILAACGGSGTSAPATNSAPVTPITGTATISGKVADSSNAPLAGVTISFGTVNAQSDASGAYTLSAASNTNALNVLSFSKTGYALQTRSTPVSLVNQATVNVDAVLLPVASTVQFSGTSAQTLTVPNSSAQVDLSANSLVRANGSTPTAPIQAELTPINPNLNGNFMPGFMGSSSSALIESNGALQVTFTDTTDGTKLQLASGQTATLRIPAVARGGAAMPSTIPLYYLNETTGLWVQEGTATLKGSGANQYYEGTVAHFSTWNCDRPYDTVYINGCITPQSSTALFSTIVFNHGVNYIGTSQAVVNPTTGQFKLPVMKNATSRIYASDFVFSSTNLDVTVGASDVTLSSCLTLTQSSAPSVTFPVTNSVTGYLGNYSGTYGGSETGTFSIAVNNAGVITGSGFSTTYQFSFPVTGTVQANGQATINASAGGTAGGAVFTGTFNLNANPQSVSGVWRYTGTPATFTNGTFSGNRIN